MKGIDVGQLVSSETHITCGRCRECLAGQAHVCEDVKILGIDVDGCFAEYVKVPAKNVWVTDPSLGLGVAAS